MRTFKGSTIIVGLSLSEHDENLLKSAANLAKKLDASLVLTHAVLPFQAYAYAGEGAFYPLSNYENSFRELSELMSLEKLNEFQKKVESLSEQGLKVTTRVVHHDPAIGLSELAKELKSDLLVCGFNSDYVKNDFFGMSTALLLMNEAPCPVLALPLNRVFDFNSSLAFADDLSQKTTDSLQTTVNFAQALDHKEFLHLHVKNISEKQIKHLTETIQSAQLEGKLPDMKDEFSEAFYVEKTSENISNQLKQRFESLESSTKTGLREKTQVAFGPIVKTIRSNLELAKTEIVGFGTHKFFDKTTFNFGKIPYHTMASMGCGVFVAH